MSAHVIPEPFLAPNRYRYFVAVVARQRAGLERMILANAAAAVSTEEGLLVALAGVGADARGCDEEVRERIGRDRADGRVLPDYTPRPPGGQWPAAVTQIASSRGGLDGMVLTAAAAHVVSEEGFRVALGALRIPVDEGWVEHLRAAGGGR